jgi:predicted dehydrogenase
MRLGLVGRGPQAQRYLMPKNGGAHIVSQVPGRIGPTEYQDWLEGVDGVIIATHPAGHRHLALDAIGAGKHVLIEKPLALNLKYCEEIIDAAEAAQVRFAVAHTHLWSDYWTHIPAEDGNVHIDIRFTEHKRDYSVWLDWGPHALAMAAELMPKASTEELLSCIVLSRWQTGRIFVAAMLDGRRPYIYLGQSNRFPMARMLESFNRGESYTLDFHRRIYRALFAQENHGTT